ncbi:hypothetical protein FA15DRAFT_673904 [Coprinopsis marcescibilis]|uniref:Uncharacterized protein n=1 Tax=Coprinopsis marcescibilis TaxID=230819 RepID=A0A5C3KIR0_COPMA|nr:hypothetical protein FA15DRAFT_673904 [Coprinopsis marcescibilis]
MVNLSLHIVCLSLFSLVALRSHASAVRRQANTVRPSKQRVVAPPTATFALASPTGSFGVPLPANRNANANVGDAAGGFLSGQTADNSIGMGDSTTGQNNPVLKSHSDGTIFDTGSSSVLGGKDDHDNTLDTSVVSAHSDSGNTGLAGHDAASPVNVKQQVSGTDTITGGALDFVQNPGSAGNSSPGSQSKRHVRADRFLRKLSTEPEKRQATTGDTLSTFTGAIPQAPGVPSTPSLPMANSLPVPAAP